MTVVIWRDSVAAGDDSDAPHEWAAPVASNATIEAVVDAIIQRRYLASISGGRATWIVEGARPLAVIAQQWTTPRWLVPPESSISTYRRPGGAPDIQMLYWLQVDPDRVYQCLRTGEPLPDRYGR